MTTEIDAAAGPVLLAWSGAPETADHSIAAALRGAAVDVEEAWIGERETWWILDTDRQRPDHDGAELAARVGAWLLSTRRNPQGSDDAEAAARPAPAASPDATVTDEVVARVPVDGAEVSCVLTPRAAPRSDGAAALLLWGGGHVSNACQNRIQVRLARRLAAEGFLVARMDYPGCGDSPGPTRPFAALPEANPVVRSAVTAVARWVLDQGASRLVLVGSCFGARTALAVARRVPEVAGLALINAPVEAAGEPTDGAVSDGVFEDISHASSREIPTLLAYGSDEDVRPAFERALGGRLGGLLDEDGSSIVVKLVDEPLHQYLTLRAQGWSLDTLAGWVIDLDLAPAPALPA
jgi:dienelactone hydrolase